ncbi:DAN domain containing protein [Asbolus verrucosus]|uniref:DAN domain containing protein n=1 Tax=Asbolus verrucosus TaxID=1661398 RepID=A0A482WCD7_ASBVE|nr:DAN domain containing protein [Asbolus verrucosus]
MNPRLINTSAASTTDECQVTPVIHVLQYPGCVPKPIPSFACIGRCASYIQVSGSKIWQMERSCMCCQESGEREASVSLFCPKAKPGERKFIKVRISFQRLIYYKTNYANHLNYKTVPSRRGLNNGFFLKHQNT